MKPHAFSRLLQAGYRLRFWAALVSLACVAAAFGGGISTVADFSKRVDALSDSPPAESQPRLFDMRTDIWFDPSDEGLSAYRDLEDQFIAEDTVIVAFEEREDPWGAFGEGALSTVRRLSQAFEQIPYVRSVRSLTESPWIRWETIEGESGLTVSDLFERPIDEYDDEARLRRMVAVLGAERASELAGKDAVFNLLGADANLSEHAGEPRFVNSIVSADGRTAAIQVQILRQRSDPETIDSAFGAGDGAQKEVGPVLHAIESQSQAVGQIQTLLAKETAYPMHVAGIPVLERHFPEVGQRDMAFMGLMFLAMALVLGLVFRRAGGVALPLLVVLASVLGMNGLVWWKGDLINNLTATTPVVITAVGIADAVHLVTSYYALRSRFSSRRELVIAVVRINALPILLTSLTTAIAFFSLVKSDIIPVRMFGYTAGIGTLIAYVLSMTVVPAALSLFPLGRAASESPEARESGDERTEGEPAAARPHFTRPLLDFVLRHRTRVLAAAGAVLALSLFGLSQVRIESDLRVMFPQDDPVRKDILWIEERLGGAGDLDLVFYGAASQADPGQVLARQRELESLQVARERGQLDESGHARLARLEAEEARTRRQRIASSAEFLAQVDAFERALSEESRDPASPLSRLTSFDSGLSVLRRIHQVQNRDQSSFYRVPVDADVDEEAREPRLLEDDVTGEARFIPGQTASSLASQYYLQYENGAKPAQNLSSLVTPDRRGFRIAARVSSGSTEELLGLYERIERIARERFPDVSASAEAVESGGAQANLRMSGKHYLFINMMDRFSETLITSMLIALTLITGLIAAVYRSLLLGVVSMVPNVLPLVIPLGVLGLLGVPLDGPAVIVATVALGVCVDDTIHFLTKYRAALRSGLDTKEALGQALDGVGSAITWTTLVLVVGFGALAFSDFRPNMMIGVLGGSMVLLAWVADLVVTPALLGALAERRRARDRDRVRQLSGAAS